MSALLLEVVTPTPTEFYHCLHCEQIFGQADIGRKVRAEELARYPAEIREDAARLQALLEEIFDRYQSQVHVRIIDPATPEGLLISVRHWVRRYPTFLIDRSRKVVGWDREALARELDEVVDRSRV
jgi:hypothetical protein